MPTHIALMEYTQKGAENIGETFQRLEEAKELAESAGGHLREFHLTLGRYDAVLIAEGPDNGTALQQLLMTAKDGFVRTETLKAFPEDEARELVAGMPG